MPPGRSWSPATRCVGSGVAGSRRSGSRRPARSSRASAPAVNATRRAGAAPRPAPPRRDAELTAAEGRVAALVATGRTSREVAGELFTTVSTLEAHLTRIYRKLGVRSRTELAQRDRDDDTGP
jgi:DNA-binding CsgD family transcriptional regulator